MDLNDQTHFYHQHFKFENIWSRVNVILMRYYKTHALLKLNAIVLKVIKCYKNWSKPNADQNMKHITSIFH